MKKSLSLVGAFALLLSCGAAFPQGLGNGTNDCTGTNFYNFDHSYSNHYYFTNSGSGPWWSDMGRWSNAPAPKTFGNARGVVAPSQRFGAGGPPTPADVQALVQQFQADRDTFMIRQRDMQRQMSTATEQERQQLRDQLRDQMRDWQKQQARVREQLTEQADRLRQQLRDHDRLLEQASKPATPAGTATQAGSNRGR
jgi:hypothetical protein